MKLKLFCLPLILCAAVACSPEPAPQQNSASATPPQTTSSDVVAASPVSASVVTASQSENALPIYHVGIDVGSPPFSMRDEQGNPIGFEVDLLNAIAQNQNFTLTFLNDKRTDLLSKINEGKYDLIAASLEVNPDNTAKFDMTQPYAKSYRAIVSRNSKPAKSFADLKNGASVAVQASTVSEKVVQELGAKTQPFPNVYSGFSAFMRGETDYIVGNSIPLDYYLKQQADANQLNMVAYDVAAGKNDLAFAVKKGENHLLNLLNAGLKGIKQDGTYDKIYEKWFKDNPDAKI